MHTGSLYLGAGAMRLARGHALMKYTVHSQLFVRQPLMFNLSRDETASQILHRIVHVYVYGLLYVYQQSFEHLCLDCIRSPYIL